MEESNKQGLKQKLHDALLNGLQKLSEKDLVENVLIPVFKVIGYDIVENHGGPDELGRDLICWRKDELGDAEVAVAQVKLYKPSRKAADKRSFSEIVTQLSQASETQIPYRDGQLYLPRTIYFVSPFIIDTRALLSRFARFSSLRSRGIKIIDGHKLVQLVSSYLPSIIGFLCGDEFLLDDAIDSQLNNEILLKALSFPHGRPLESFYTDIDFSVGKRSTRQFLFGDFVIQQKSFRLDEKRWTEIKRLSDESEKVFGTQIVTEPPDLIERRYLEDQKTWEKLNKEITKLSRSISPLEDRIKKLQNKLLKSISTDHCIEDKDLESTWSRIDEIGNRLGSVVTEPEMVSNRLRGTRNMIKSFGKNLPKLEKKLKIRSGIIKNLLENLLHTTENILPLVSRRKKAREKGQTPFYRAALNSKKLATAFMKKRDWILIKLKSFHDTPPTPAKMKSFLQLYREIVNCDLTQNYVPTLIRELSTFFILQSGRRSVAEPGGLQLAAKAAGVI